MSGYLLVFNWSREFPLAGLHLMVFSVRGMMTCSMALTDDDQSLKHIFEPVGKRTSSIHNFDDLI